MKTEEIWKDIKNWEGQYQVSNYGRVKSLKRSKEQILKPSDNGFGYEQVMFSFRGTKKTTTVHRLVAETFVPNPYNLSEINHIDENKTNNRADNLEWCTRGYNINYGERNKKVSNILKNNYKTGKSVLCVELNKIFPSTKEVEIWLGKKYSQTNICACCNGRIKTAYGYHWEYAE